MKGLDAVAALHAALKPEALPEELRDLRASLADALDTPLLAEWPEDESFQDADQPRAIAKVLIGALHTHLRSARIAYLFRKEMAGRGKVKLGTAGKASAKITYLTDHDFVIEFNWTMWRTLEPQQRIALVDHELCHCAREEEVYGVRPHDIEEFGEIVRRWGLWKGDLIGFGRDMAPHLEQFGLFESVPPK